MKKIRYVAFLNLSGLSSKEPIKCYADKENEYWSDDGNTSAYILGLIERQGYIEFVSENQREVELWLSGAKSVMKLLRRWAS